MSNHNFEDEYIFSAASEGQPLRIFPENNCTKKLPSRCIYQEHCFEVVVKFFEKWSSVFSKFACKAFLLLTNGIRRAIFHQILLNNYFCGTPL